MNILLIKTLMLKNNMQYKELAKILNISVNSVGKKLRNEIDFKINELIKMSIFFNEPIENFFNEGVVKNTTF